MSSFSENLILIATKAPAKGYLVLYLTINLLLAYIGYFESSCIAQLIQDPTTVWQVMLWLGLSKIISPILMVSSDFAIKTGIMEKIDDEAYTYYWALLLTGSPEWLEKNDEISTSIEKGIHAIKTTCSTITSLSRPVLRLLSSVAFVTVLTPYGFHTIWVLVLFILFGYYLTCDNFNKAKAVKTANKVMLDIARDESRNIFVRILNHKGEKAVHNITSSFLLNNASIRANKLLEVYRFGSMDVVFGIINTCLTSYVIYMTDNVMLSPVIYMTINRGCESAWAISSKMRRISEGASGWGPLEKSLSEYETYEQGFDHIDVEDIMVGEDEVQLYGKSGCGKTTYMSQRVCKEFINTAKGQFIYMDQKMKLLKSQRNILSIMGDDLDHDSQMDVTMLLHYAKIMGIDNLINVATVRSPFEKPSGGEEKRIMILRALLPLLLDVSNVKIIFNDEITAGLDDDSWHHVRDIIDILKAKNVKFITIDHHKLGVRKRSTLMDGRRAFLV